LVLEHKSLLITVGTGFLITGLSVLFERSSFLKLLNVLEKGFL